MKTTLLSLTLLICALSVHAQDSVPPEPTQKTDATYRLFRTQNIYTFLKLDTRTGQVWQVQWGNETSYRWVQPIALYPLADGKKAGRFTLHPTTNIYNFILLDQDDGRMWQVQWGKEDERLITPIGATR